MRIRRTAGSGTSTTAPDVILVKYGNDERWKWTLPRAERLGRVLARDNTHDNIGLVAARIELIRKSTADFILLMDYDFTRIEVDMHSMQRHPFTQPGIKGLPEWTPAYKYPCNFMLIARDEYDKSGGLNPEFHTAYADWDLIQRMCPMMQHNRSFVDHVGSSSSDHKRRIWAADRAVYDSMYSRSLNEDPA